MYPPTLMLYSDTSLLRLREQAPLTAQGLTTQPQIFAGAIANFLTAIGLPYNLVFTLINLSVSAFALTSLDSVRFRQPAFVRIGSDRLRRVPEKDKQAGIYAVDSHVLYDGCYLYRTFYDDL